ncbi:MAG TPA: hypothetical protein VKA85_00100, partial [Candidatus Limnocylindrales bacterium]|nr:hypothetical protein [Candidatus Limnocylindrales bacterium]
VEAFARAGEAMRHAGATIAESSTSPIASRPAAPAAAAARPAAAAPPTAPTASPPPAASDRAAGPPRLVPRDARAADRGAAGIGHETTLDDAALRLANELEAVPGIERFGAIRLADLDRTGPRPLRTMWRIARDELDARYGNLTIREMLDRYRGGPSTHA